MKSSSLNKCLIDSLYMTVHVTADFSVAEHFLPLLSSSVICLVNSIFESRQVFISHCIMCSFSQKYVLKQSRFFKNIFYLFYSTRVCLSILSHEKHAVKEINKYCSACTHILKVEFRSPIPLGLYQQHFDGGLD